MSVDRETISYSDIATSLTNALDSIPINDDTGNAREISQAVMIAFEGVYSDWIVSSENAPITIEHGLTTRWKDVYKYVKENKVNGIDDENEMMDFITKIFTLMGDTCKAVFGLLLSDKYNTFRKSENFENIRHIL